MAGQNPGSPIRNTSGSLNFDLYSMLHSSEEAKVEPLDECNPLPPVFKELSTSSSPVHPQKATPFPNQQLRSIEGKRKADEDPGSDGEAEKQQPPKKQKNEAPFACPFWKLDPLKYHECAKFCLQRMRDVKEHLKRKHTPSHYCPRCQEIFSKADDLQEHVSSNSGWLCLPFDLETLDGVSHGKNKELHLKSDASLTTEDQWFSVWDILFPATKRPCSAYVDPEIYENLAYNSAEQFSHQTSYDSPLESGLLSIPESLEDLESLDDTDPMKLILDAVALKLVSQY
ncbi:hypothetical protein CSHISOI_02869, partial [Colletotrichum shisoi]